MTNPSGSAPVLAELVVAGDRDAWSAAGFTTEDDTVAVGSVSIRLAGASGGRRIVEWRLAGLATADLDGLPTAVVPAAPDTSPAVHPNGVLRLDHVVAFTPDLDRTVSALEAAGLDLRRIREGPTPAGAQRQAFFRVGEPILEVVEAPPGSPGAEDPDGPARFYGLAFTVGDLDASAETLEGLLGEVRDAVQPGRRIATVRREAGLGLAVALMSESSG